MAKQLNVALDFTANTTQAKQQIQELQQLLTKVAYSTDLGVNPEQMQKASAAAKELAIHLNEAYNTTTGNYDLSKLNASLARSKTSVTELSNGLLQAGATGQQAFIKLAQSIAAADQPMITLNARLQDFLTTVKNTVKWQISSSMIHGVMGALQGAYGYAQDLNKSLNDIRIVTGHNIDYMDKFADKANKAAKALSTSTLNYTDASLIYYQQGLSDQEVEDRTAVTIKMANAAGESADKVSQQLTAVWNNFYDGSQSLEYYADVMTALGAATASSTDEIAEGLEKFAAVSNTVGLSYEYATSALATVTATTRQSADVVGTAFKTLFARIQDLELGKTLDDGTTLGKYSQALDAVGVAIKTADGGLRDMDDILSDLGEKWNSLDAEGNPLISKDAKVALAQTVAGVRQYTQLMALMDNWDFMKENLETARNATGTLTEQQKIYEESWEAANKRLKASFESLYQNLIDDKFFIKFTDFLSDMVDGVDSFIDKIGGLKTVLIGILSITTNLLSSKIQPAINNIINNIQIMAGGANKVYAKIRNEVNDQIDTTAKKYNLSDYDKQALQNVSQLNIMKQKLADQTDHLSDSERRLAEITIQGFEMSQQEILKATKQLGDYRTQVQELQEAIPDGGIDYTDVRSKRIKSLQRGAIDQTQSEIETADSIKEVEILQQNLKDLSDAAFNAEVAVDGSIKTISSRFMELGQAGKEQIVQGSEAFTDLISSLDPLSTKLDGLSQSSIQSQTAVRSVRREIDVLGGSLPEVVRQSRAVDEAFKAIQQAKGPKELQQAISKLQIALKNVEINGKNVNQVLSQLGTKKKDINIIVDGYKEISQQQKQIEKQQKEQDNKLNSFNPKHLASYSEVLMKTASAATSAIMAVNSFKSAFESLADPDLSTWEKISSVVMSLTFGLGYLKSGITSAIDVYNGFNSIVKANYATIVLSAKGVDLDTAAKIKNSAATFITAQAENVLNGSLDKDSFALALTHLGLSEDIAIKIADAAATGGLSAAMKILNGELSLLLLKLLPIIAIGAAIGLAIWGITKAVKANYQETHKAQIEAEKTNETLEKTKTAYDGVKSSLDSLSSTLSTFDSKYKSLSDMKKGSSEWRDAVFDLNQEMTNTLDLLNMLDGEGIWFTYDSDGVMRWTKEGQVEAEKRITDKKNAQRGVELTSGNVKNSTDAEASKEKLLNNNKLKYKSSKRDQSNKNKQATWDELTPEQQAQYHSAANYNRTVSPGTKRDLYLKNNPEAAGKESQYIKGLNEDQLNTILNAFEEYGTLNLDDAEGLKELGITDSVADWISTNDELKQSINDLRVSIDRDNELTEASIKNALISSGKIDFDAEEIPEAYREGVLDAISRDIKEYVDENSVNYDPQDYFESYAEAAGYGQDIDGKWYQKTEDGFNKENELTLDDTGTSEMIQQWAAYMDALDGFTEDISRDYADVIKDSDQTWNAIDQLKPSWEAENSAASNMEDTINKGLPEHTEGETQEEYLDRYQAATEEQRQAAIDLQNYILENKELFADMFGMSTEGFENWAKNLTNISDNYDLLNEAMENSEGAINKLRDIATISIDDVENLSKAWNNSKDELNKYIAANKDSKDPDPDGKLQEFFTNNAEALGELAGVNAETMANMLASDREYVSKSAPLIPKLVNKDQRAIMQLRALTEKKMMLSASDEELLAALKNCEWAAGMTADEIREKLTSAWDDMYNMLSNEDIDIDVVVNSDKFKAACNDIIKWSGMTSTTAQQEFGKMGYNLEITPAEVQTVDTTVSGEVWDPLFDKDGHHITGSGPHVVTEGIQYNYVTPPVAKTITAGGFEFGGEKILSKGNGNSAEPVETGGNGSGGSYTAPPPKEYKDEIERYHVIKQKIEDLEEVLEHLSKAKDRAFGTSKLELMDQEIEKYNEMIDLQNQYLDEINKYWEEDRALIASYGAIFDDTGVIINYDEIMKRQIDKYNASIGKNKETDEAAEEAYDDFLEALDQYEETNNLRQDELEKLYELQTELADVIFEKTQYKIEIKIAVKDDELDYLEYLLSKIEDDAYAAAEAIALMGEKAENALEKTKIYSEGLMELLSNHGINSLEELDNLSVDDLKAKEFTEDEIDQIREWKSSILEANQELLEMRNTIQEKVLDSFNQFSDDLQKQMDLFEHYQTILESVKDITSLLGTELTKSSKEVIRNLNRAMLDNNINNLASQKTVLETYQEQQKQAQAAYDHAKEINDTKSIRQWEETLSEINDKVNEAEENFLDIWQETLEQAKDIYEEEMDNIAKDFEEGISPIYGAIDVLQDTIGRAREINEQYLEDYEKTYELNKLAREIQGSIDDTDIISNKKKLSALQDEINRKLKDGIKMSEYDLKILQQKYELELAHQALDDAKNGNERVRLARDGNGNWGYIYTADEDKIAEAEQNYEDKLKAMQDANKEYLQTLEDNILTLQQTWQQAISEINLSYANGEITKAEQEARIAEINEYYATRMEQLKGEYEKMFSNSQEFAERFQKYFKDVNLDIASSFDKTSLAIKTGYTSLTELFEGFWRSHDSYLTSATMLLEQYREKLSEVSSVAGTISSAFASEANGWAINITGNSKDVVADVEKIAKNATDSFNKVLEAASDFEQMYADRLDEIIKKNEDLVTSMRKMIAALSGLETATFETNRDAINNLSTTTPNNRASTMRNSETFNTYKLEQNENSLMAVQSSLIDAIDNFKPIEIDKTVSLADSYLESLDIDKILQYISSSVSILVNQLGGLKSFIISTPVEHTFEQTVNINADFPNATDSSEILEAFDIMEEEASQFANKKSI